MRPILWSHLKSLFGSCLTARLGAFYLITGDIYRSPVMVLSVGSVIMRMRMILAAVESVMMVRTVMSADLMRFMISARDVMKRKKRGLLSVQRVM